MEFVQKVSGWNAQEEERRQTEGAAERILAAGIKKAVGQKWKKTVLAWSLLAPSLMFLYLFTLQPIIKSFINSLYKDNLSTLEPVFIGAGNYAALLKDPVFWECFRNNLLIAVVTVPLSIALAVAFALFEKSVKHGKMLVRIGFIYPAFIPLVAAANIWMYIYTPIYGLLGYINPNWRFLADGKTAIWALMVMLVWKQAGYLMLFYMSGLNGISKELLEASKIDGAGPARTFLHVTWPLLAPTTMYVFIIALTNAYKMVDHLYIMTKGGPGNATNVLLFYIYQTGFDYWDMGKASAITVVLVVVLLIITCVKFFSDDRKAYYN